MIAAVRGGLLSLDEACSRYMLTVEEYLSWQHPLTCTASLACALRAPSNIGTNNGLSPIDPIAAAGHREPTCLWRLGERPKSIDRQTRMAIKLRSRHSLSNRARLPW